MGAVIRGKAPVTSLSFHEDGQHLFIASAGDSKLRFVDCLKGAICADQPDGIKLEKDGVRLVEATHHNYSVLTAGEGKSSLGAPLPHTTPPAIQRYQINYLSVYDDKILRTFQGHTNEVCNLSMSPVDDLFLSSSRDRSVRMWNLQQGGCLAELKLPGSLEKAPHAAFDATGLVFGVTGAMAAGAGNLIQLYDARKYSGGPFAELKLDRSILHKTLRDKGISPTVSNDLSRAEWTSLRFNASGKQMLIETNRGLSLMLDGFDGNITQLFVSADKDVPATPATTITNPSVDDSTAMSACFTADDRFVLGGCADGTIRCWNATSGLLINKLEGHVGRVAKLGCNPKYSMFASSCTNTALWIW